MTTSTPTTPDLETAPAPKRRRFGKRAAALGVAAALLAGSFSGSFALIQGKAQAFGSQSITVGDLAAVAQGNPVWQSNGNTVDPSTFILNAGQTVSGTSSVQVTNTTGHGANLTVALSQNLSGLLADPNSGVTAQLYVYQGGPNGTQVANQPITSGNAVVSVGQSSGGYTVQIGIAYAANGGNVPAGSSVTLPELDWTITPA